MELMNILLMAPTNGESGGNGWSSMLMILLMVLLFWLFFIHPQSKKNKEIAKFREGLKKGDRVITIGGIHGKVLEVGNGFIIIETEGQGKLKMEKSAIAQEFREEEMAK